MISTKTAISVLWLTLTCFVCFGTFVLKNRVHELEIELVRLNKGIQNDVKTIHVLKAEWSHLNSPARLRQLAEEHILLNKARPEQIINLSALPFAQEYGGVESAYAPQNIEGYKVPVRAQR